MGVGRGGRHERGCMEGSSLLRIISDSPHGVVVALQPLDMELGNELKVNQVAASPSHINQTS